VQLARGARAVGFGRELRQRIASEGGVSAFLNLTATPQFPNPRQFSFSKGRKFVAEEAELRERRRVPGPGAYNLAAPKAKHRGSKFARRPRTEMGDGSAGPGPTTYTPIAAYDHTEPRIPIGQQTRETSIDSATPGPGTYELPPAEVALRRETAPT
jgi:hypothetical protein